MLHGEIKVPFHTTFTILTEALYLDVTMAVSEIQCLWHLVHSGYSGADVTYSQRKTNKVKLHCCSEWVHFEHATNSNQLLYSLLGHYLRYSPCNNIHDLETETSLHPHYHMHLMLRHLATSHDLARIYTLMPSSKIDRTQQTLCMTFKIFTKLKAMLWPTIFWRWGTCCIARWGCSTSTSSGYICICMSDSHCMTA